jgi:DNA-binding transcriptional regulator YdaS (Cro superfamily)
VLTITQMRAKLRTAVKEAGGQKQFAELIDVSPQYVCDCLKGRRDIGQSIARPLGFEPVTMYVRATAE